MINGINKRVDASTCFRGVSQGSYFFSDGVFGKLGYAVNIQLVHNICSVCFDGFDADMKGGGYVLGALPF